MANNLGADTLTATTSSAKDSWQEALSKWQTVPAARVAQAAEVIRGLAGSWAASYQFDSGVRNDQRATDARVSNPQQFKVSKLGQPGFPEINFAPYNWGTNRFGAKGGSFIGHPISFSVVGPTLKRIDTWQWAVTAGGPGVGDVLTLNQAGGVPIQDIFGFADLTMFPGGLYMVVSQTGSEGTVDGAAGGIGDGPVIDLLAVGYNGLDPIGTNSKYEIFRIVDMDNVAGTLTLDSSKHLADYFTIPGANPVIRAITLLQPQATRLVAVPGSGDTPKLAKAFAVVPPKRALGTDEKYRYDTWTTNPNWTESNLADFDLLQGDEFDYKYGPQLPIPRTLGTWHGRLHGINPTTGLAEADAPVLPCKAGTFILRDAPVPGYSGSLVGKILHIQAVTSVLNASLREGGTTGYQVPNSALVGWFEVVDSIAGPPFACWVLRRLEENNPSTGFSRIGAGEFYTVDSTAPAVGKGIFVDATVHEPVSALWDTSYGDIDKIQSARLTNLIDPRWTERSLKTVGVDPGRADRAVFDTSSSLAGADGSNADPGSLLDLGFRMVLFPAKVGTELDPGGGPAVNVLVPDWDRPVTSNEFVLDPSKLDEKQYVEVDYANGLVRFSHPIKSGSPLYPSNANVFTTDNSRGEMVLFACCVPYSMEEGQLGAGSVRVTGGQPSVNDAGSCEDTPETKDTVDVFSDRIVVPCRTNPAQNIVQLHDVDGTNDLVLQGNWVHRIPYSGFFELLQGDKADGEPVFPAAGQGYRGSLYGYLSTSYDTATNRTTLHDIYGGGKVADTFTIDAANPAVAVFRREVVTPNDDTGKAGVDYQFDTTYGSAKRALALRFDDADVEANSDGSVTVRARGTQTQNLKANFKDMFSSWILDDASLTTGALSGGFFPITVGRADILMQGQRIHTPGNVVQIPAVDDVYYVYFENNDGTTCPACTYTTSFPLADPNDILVARVVISGVGTVATTTNLQNPLTDLDRRLDIYVGEVGQDAWGAAPNFLYLWQAVEYANEMMAPSSQSPVATPYKNVRIVVVGRTHEPTGRLPIQIKTDGLVIEGTPYYFPGSPAGATVSEVSWDDPTKNLIDLNGHANLEFRNIAFRYEDNAAPVGGTNSVFTNTAGNPANITIEGCRVAGYALHFIDVSTGGLLDSVIRGNAAASLVGSGFYCVGGASVYRTLIENNIFTTSVAARGPCGIEIVNAEAANFHNTTVANDVTLRNNYVQNFSRGIWVGSGSGVIEGNYINNMERSGIVVAGGFQVRDNILGTIYTGALAGDLWAAKYGVLFYTNAADTASLEHNYVEMDAAVVGDYDDAIHVLNSAGAAATSVSVKGNLARRDGVFWYIYVWAWSGVVQGNVSSRLWVDGKLNLIQGNSATDLAVNFDIPASAGSTLEHAIPASARNRVIGNAFTNGYAWDHTIVQGNEFTGTLYFQHDCKLETNYIALLSDFNGVGALAADSQRAMILGNQIVAVQTGGAVANKLSLEGPFVVVGNRVTGIFEVLDATNGLVNGNSFTNALKLGVTTASEHVTVSGNWIGVGGLTIGAAGQVADMVTVTGNKMVDVAGTTGLVAFANQSTFSGNNTLYGALLYGIISVTGGHNTITGNATGDLTVAGAQNLIQANKFLGNLTITNAGDNNLIAQNFGRTAGSGKILVQCNNTVLNGNLVLGIEFADTLTHSVITGNLVQGDIILGTIQANQVDPVTIVGNLVTGGISSAAAKAASAVVTGNVAATVFTVAPAAANVDANNANV